MRITWLIFFLPIISYAQNVVDLKNKIQVQNYIANKFKYHNDKYSKFVIAASDTTNFDTFKEGDFNKDGISDQFIFGTAYIIRNKAQVIRKEALIILGDRVKPKKVIFPANYFNNLFIPVNPAFKVISKNDKNYIQLEYTTFDKLSKFKETHIDTFNVNNDRLMPYSKSTGNQHISSIQFKTSGCYGTCPIFELIINKNKKVDYTGIDFVNKKGHYDLMIDSKDWNYLNLFLQNIQVKKLKDNYAVNWTDDQTGYLTINFENGETKKIQDYGMVGTYKLSVLYNFLMDLSKF